MSGTGPPPLGLRDTIAASVRAETVVTRSRFIATVTPVGDEAAADEVVAAIRREFHDARHQCTAMVLGPHGQRQRSNDDGEPAGTAGAPMLAVLRGSELTDVVAVVTRYFGGTLLGAGGLVRAYGGAVTAALDLARRRSRRPVEVIELRVAHEHAGRLEHRLRGWADQRSAAQPVGIGDGRYSAAGACFELMVPTELVGDLTTLLATAGIDHERQDRGTVIREVDV